MSESSAGSSLIQSVLNKISRTDCPGELAQSFVDLCLDECDASDVVLTTGNLLADLHLPSLYRAGRDPDEAEKVLNWASAGDRSGYMQRHISYHDRQCSAEVLSAEEGLTLVVVREHQAMTDSLRENVGHLLSHILSLFRLMTREKIERHRVAALEKATSVAGIGYFEWVIGSTHMDWDRQMMDLFAVQPLEYSGNPEEFTERIHPEDRDRLLSGIDEFIRVADENDGAEFSFRIVDNVGETKKVVAHVSIRDNPDGSRTLVGTNYDVTQLEKARAHTLRRSELEQLLLRLSMDIILSSGDSIDRITEGALKDVGRFVGADRAYRFEYDFVADVANNTHEWCEEGVSAEIDNLQNVPVTYIPYWVNAHKKGLPFYMSRVADLPDGHGLREILDPQGVQSIVTIPLMQNGECTGFIGFDSVQHTRHWTEAEVSLLEILAQMLINAQVKNDYQRELLEARSALQWSRDEARKSANEAISANVAKSRFIASVSHELRTPLHAIIGLTETLLAKILDSDDLRKLHSIRDSGSILLDLINDILDYSRIESGGILLQPRAVNIREVLDSLVETFSAEASRRNLFIRLTVDAALPEWMTADPLRIRQVLSNLVGNALKFTEYGGVTIEVRREVDPDDAREAISFQVRDTGIGIEKNELKHIFDPFYQSDDRDSRKYSGTGLGLSIVRNLVHQMNGEVSVDSQIGKGAEFFVRLPLEVCRQEESPSRGDMPRLSSTAGDLAGKRIYLAEDNPMNRQLLSIYLEGAGCDLVMVDNGEELLELFGRQSADLVLMDCQMPVMDGFTATGILRTEYRQGCDLPIIAVTASAQKDNYTACIDAGFDDVLVKPFSKSELLAMLGHWLGMRGADLPVQS